MVKRIFVFLNVFIDEVFFIFFFYLVVVCGCCFCVEWFLGNISSVGNERNKFGFSFLYVVV